MLNAIITANDQTAIIEFPIDQFDLYKQLGQIGIRKGPHKIALTDDEDAEIQVKLYADNDFGNHVIRLFHERDTLDDVHTAVGAIDIASDDVKEQLEEYILHDQLEGTGHLYNTIREIKESIAPIVNLNCETPKGHDHDDIEFRVRDGSILSYFTYQLPKESIHSVILGPKCTVDFAQLTLFLNRYAPHVRINNEIHHSKITYR